MKKKYYLAYGSNLNVAQMKYRCPNARRVGIGFIPDYHLLFRGSKTGAYLTIEPFPGKSVPVGIWEVGPADERSLDLYEGYPSFYFKKGFRVSVKDDTGEPREIDAFAYIMNPERPFGMPSVDYVRVCAKGYDDFGIDPEPLVEAISFTRKEIA